MTIRNVQWVTKDKITTFPKLQYMVQDEINSTDNIHPQYWQYLSFWESFTKKLEGTGDTTEIICNLISGHYGFSKSGFDVNPEAYYACGTFAFIRGITTAADAGARVKTIINTGIAVSDVKFRISAYKNTYADPAAKTPISNGTAQDGSGSYANYSASFDLSGADSKDLIFLDFEIKIDNVRGNAGRVGKGVFANPYFTRTQPKL